MGNATAGDRTAAGLIARCEVLGISLQAHGGRLRLDGREDDLTPELVAKLQAHAAELLEQLQSHGDGDAAAAKDLAAAPQAMTGPAGPRRTAVPVAVEWPTEAADFCLLLATDDLPPVPFKLNPWTEVRDRAKFLRWLQTDARRGPSGPRAFYGAMQRDLQDLKRFALQEANKRQQEGKPTR